MSPLDPVEVMDLRERQHDAIGVLDVERLRLRLRESYNPRPDDSHGEPYVNRGLVNALRIVAELVGDIDFETPCEADAELRSTADVWCKAHIAPMGSRWCCDLAESPWVWHDARLAEPDA